jgi:MFS family permease
VGTHLLMPVRSSISMDLADASRKGRRLGQISGVGAAASIVGCAVVWGAMRLAGAGYSTIYILGGLAGLGAAAALARMRLPGAHLRRPRFVWNRRYWLYYVLAFLFGARKQIFITFGPWVLIKVFGQPAYVIAQLWMAAGVLGILVQPLLGRAIDRFGERAVLTVDAITLFLVCAGYGGAHLIPGRAAALAVLYACFVLDLVLFGVNMARDTYVAKIALKPEHVAPTLSLGVTINHVVSMSIPAAGGWLWARHGHPAVFVAASGVAVLMVAFTACIRVPPTPRAGALRGS